jgi:hypothetical protein
LDADGVAECRKKLGEVLKKHRNEDCPSDSLIIIEQFSPDAADCLLGKQSDMIPPPFKIF